MNKLPEGLSFPPELWWGASTAAYQIEGGNSGSDLWDWELRRGWERSGACANSWELWREDVRCLTELGCNAYRFSVEWGRLFPEPGRLDEAALRRYEELVAALRALRIRPIVCLHHFTQPAWFWRRHPLGWSDPKAAETFLEFVRPVASAFAGSVDDWIVFNEPMVLLAQGHLTGHFPPGLRSIAALDMNPPRLRSAVRTMVSAHRLAAEAIRSLDRVDADGDGKAARIGIAHNIAHLQPVREADREAVLLWDQFLHWNFLDGVVDGRMDLDLDGEAETEADGPGGALDFVGVNYYTRTFVRRLPFLRGRQKGLPLYLEISDRLGAAGRLVEWACGLELDRPRDDMGREIYPEGLEAVLRTVHRRYKLPVAVTENGVPDSSGRLRELYVLGHLLALSKAAADVPVLGYLHWSLVDNYEWSTFGPRFGLYRVEYGDGFKRTLTPGGRLFGEIVRSVRAKAAA